MARKNTAPNTTNETADQTAATVTVGCKLPNGFVLEVGNQSVVLNGSNSSALIGGHGITHGVDAQLWQAWLEQHAERDMVKNGFVFAHEKSRDAKAEAQEKADNANGLEALTPDDAANGVATAEAE